MGTAGCSSMFIFVKALFWLLGPRPPPPPSTNHAFLCIFQFLVASGLVQPMRCELKQGPINCLLFLSCWLDFGNA